MATAFPTDTTVANYNNAARTVGVSISDFIENIGNGGSVIAGTNVDFVRQNDNSVRINVDSAAPQGTFVNSITTPIVQDYGETIVLQRVNANNDNVIDIGVAGSRTDIAIGFQDVNAMHRFAANELGVPASSFEGIYTIPPLDTMVPGTGDRTIAFSDVSPLNSLTVPVGSIIEVGTNHGVATGFANGTIDITILSATNDWVTNEAALELLTPGYTFTTTHERTVGNQVLTGNIVTDSTLGVNAMGQLGVHTNTIDDVTQDFSVGVSLADASFTFDSVDLSATNDTEITFANRSAANAFWMGLGRADAEMSGSSNSCLLYTSPSPRD